jgi:hypothetical protein
MDDENSYFGEGTEETFFDVSVDEKVAALQEQSEKIVKDQKVFRRFLEKQYNRVSDVSELVSLPKENEQIRIITQKAFNAYALLLYIVERHMIEECYLTTYNMDKNTIMGLETLIQSDNIKKLTILISESVIFRMPARARELKATVRRNDNIRMIFCWNHTKIIACKTDAGHFVIEGSGNLSDNARVEQYLFENCRETYDFHKKWIEAIKDLPYKAVKYFE